MDGAGNVMVDANNGQFFVNAPHNPLTTNIVGDPHTFYVQVWKDAGDGQGYVYAEGENPLVTFTHSDPAAVITSSTTDCDTSGTDANGICEVTFNTDRSGTIAAHGEVNSVDVGGTSLSRNTDGQNGNSGDGLKVYVDANVEIEAQASTYQQVGDTYVFTVNVQRDDGYGAGLIPTDTGPVTVNLTHSDPTATITPLYDQSTCDEGAVDGTCTLAFITDKTGYVTGYAEANVNVAFYTLNRVSGEQVITFVDANISIDPVDDTNGIGEDHEFIVTVKVDDGTGDGLMPYQGASPQVAITPAPNSGPGLCGTTDVNGACTVVINSDTIGTFTANASVNLDHLFGIALSRQTDGYAGPGGSGPATKSYVSGSLIWFKQDSSGNPLGGATFQVCRTLDRFGTDIEDECFDVLDNSAPDVDQVEGAFELVDLKLGEYTIQETAAPDGYLIDDASVKTFSLDIDSLVNPDPKPIWVNLPNQGCTAGWWKNSGLGAYDDPNDPLALAVTTTVADYWFGGIAPPGFDGTHSSLFREAFNLTEADMTARNLDPNLTLLGAVELGGGDFNALARQGTSALLNSLSVAYEFSAEQVLQEVHDAFISGVIGDLVTKYDTANKRDHGFCPTG
jgi:hypothetical protein